MRRKCQKEPLHVETCKCVATTSRRQKKAGRSSAFVLSVLVIVVAIHPAELRTVLRDLEDASSSHPRPITPISSSIHSPGEAT